MTDPVTVSKLLSVPTRGSDSGTWDTPVNGDFVAIDGMLGGFASVALSSSNVTLTTPTGSATPGAGPTQCQNALIRFTGTLTTNVSVTFPLPGFYIVENLCTGNFTIGLRSSAGGKFVCPAPGQKVHVFADGSDMDYVDLPAVGVYWDIAATSVPIWVTNCSKPPFLNCDGSTFSSVTYPFLYAFLGNSTTLPDARGRYGATLNQGTSRITSGSGGVNGDSLFATGGAQTYTLVLANLPAYTPSGSVLITPGTVPIYTGGGGGAFGPAASQKTNFQNNYTVNPDFVGSFTGIAQGGTSTPFTKLPPTYMSGIRLIRAA